MFKIYIWPSFFERKITVFGFIILKNDAYAVTAQNLIYIFVKKNQTNKRNKNHDEQKLKMYDNEHKSSAS